MSDLGFSDLPTGISRLWRDLGYAIGTLLTGFIANWLGLEASILTIGLLTLLSAGIVQARMESKNYLKC